MCIGAPKIFISALRSLLLQKGKYPLLPCPHAELCSLPGINPLPEPGPRSGDSRAKWCHFAFDTEAAPAALHKLSLAAQIPKERATMSFLLSGPENLTVNKNAPVSSSLKIRIISDTFPLSFAKDRIGCYGCSERGMVLVTGKRNQNNELASGTLHELPLPKKEQYDPKTGAVIYWI